MTDLLLNAREWRGVWWHPSDEESVFTGTLTFKPDDGLSLVVIGVRPDWPQAKEDGLFPGSSTKSGAWDVLHGVDEHGIRITLLDALLRRTGVGQVLTQELVVVQALVGCHLATEDSPAFDSMEAAIEGLTEFARLSEAPGESRVSFELGKAGYKATLRLVEESSGTHSDRGFSRRVVTQAVFSAVSPNPTSAQHLIELAAGLEQLLTIAYHFRMRTYELRLRLVDHAGDTAAARRVWVDWYQSLGPAPLAGKPPNRPLLVCDRVTPAQVISRWFVVSDEYRGACQMLLMLLYESTLFIYPRVVTAVTAAEAMQSALVSRGKREEPSMLDVDRYRELSEMIEEAVPAETLSEVKRLLRGNRAGLDGQLNALMLGSDDLPIGGLVPDSGKWAKVVAAARNKISHGSIKGVPDPGRLQAIIETCQALVTLRLFEQLGLPEDELREVVDRSGHLRWVRGLARQSLA